MAVSSTFHDVPAGLGEALENRGFTGLTAVQAGAIAPELIGRDLRMSSQTGSGKTVALGLVIARHLENAPKAPERQGRHKNAHPTALVVAPTRELAAQVGKELSWLYRPLRARVAVVTGGTGIGGDFRALAEGPRVIAGTPGRLLDHLRRGSIDASQVEVVVLDEADEMLDMGFRDELDGILEHTPDERRTHLVSATLPHAVMRLANKYQTNPARIEGTPVGAANSEITHVAHLVYERDRLAALSNILLATKGEQTLVFVRTRVQTTQIAAELSSRGFAVTPLSGEMGQRERNAALSAFRDKAVRAVVATDVAARGLDINDVARVVHFDPPEQAESYTHRSGRTGRAGKLGVSVALVNPSQRSRVEWMAKKANVKLNWEPLPTAKAIHAISDQRLIDALEEELASPTKDGGRSERLKDLATSLLAGRDPATVLAQVLSRSSHAGPTSPVDITQPVLRSGKNAGRRDRDRDRGRNQRGFDRNSGNWGRNKRADFRGDARGDSRQDSRGDSRQDSRRDSRDGGRPMHDRSGPRRPNRAPGQFTPFFVSWGASKGANPARLLAMVCRRGGIKGNQVGAIRIDAHRAVVEVASHLADDFAREAAKRDTRNPQVKISPWRGAPE